MKADCLFCRIAARELPAKFVFENERIVVPSDYKLHANYPNPFNPMTTIRYDLPEAASVRLTVFDALGRTVRKIDPGLQLSGIHAFTIDAGDLPSGIYFYRLEAGSYTATKSLVLAR